MRSHAPRHATAIQHRPLSLPQAQLFCGTSLITGGPFLLTTLNPRFSASLFNKILYQESQPLPPPKLLGPGGGEKSLALGLLVQSLEDLEAFWGSIRDSNLPLESKIRPAPLSVPDHPPAKTERVTESFPLRLPDLCTEVRHTVREAKLHMAGEMRKLFQKAQDFLGEWMRGNWTPDPGHTSRTLKGWFWLATGTSLTGAGLILSAMLLHK